MILPVLTYYGYTRLLLLDIKDVKTYITPYFKLSKADEHNKVVIFIDVEKGEQINRKTFKSLLDQTVKVDEINYLCPESIQAPSDLSVITNFCYKSENAKSVDDIIKECIKHPREKNCRILIVKNGNIYGKDFVEKIIDGYNSQNKKNLVFFGDESKIIKYGVVYNIDIDFDNYDEQIIKPCYKDIF